MQLEPLGKATEFKILSTIEHVATLVNNGHSPTTVVVKAPD